MERELINRDKIRQQRQQILSGVIPVDAIKDDVPSSSSYKSSLKNNKNKRKLVDTAADVIMDALIDPLLEPAIEEHSNRIAINLEDVNGEMANLVADLKKNEHQCVSYSLEEKEGFLRAMDKLRFTEGVSERQAMDAISRLPGGPSRTALFNWKNSKISGGSRLGDGRVLNGNFEDAVLDKLWFNHVCSANAEVNPDMLCSMSYTYAMIKATGEEVQKEPKWEAVNKVQKLKFSSHWISSFINRVKDRRRKKRSSSNSTTRPGQSKVTKDVAVIQTLIRELGVPASNIFNATQAQFCFGTASGSQDPANKLTDLMAISIEGKTLPQFFGVRNSSNAADLTFLNALKADLTNAEGLPIYSGPFLWEKQFDIPTENRQADGPTTVTIKKHYLEDRSTKSIICCQHQQWMSRSHMCMWVDLIMGPWTKANGGVSVVLSEHRDMYCCAALVEHFLTWGIHFRTLPKDMTDVFQVLELVFSGPMKRSLKRDRCVQICEGLSTTAVKSMPWSEPIAPLSEGIRSCVNYGITKNEDAAYHKAIKGCFVKVGLWFNEEDKFYAYTEYALLTGHTAIGKHEVFGAGQDHLTEHMTLEPPEIAGQVDIDSYYVYPSAVDEDGLDAAFPYVAAFQDVDVVAEDIVTILSQGSQLSRKVVTIDTIIDDIRSTPLMSDEEVLKVNTTKMFKSLLEARGIYQYTYAKKKFKQCAHALLDYENIRRAMLNKATAGLVEDAGGAMAPALGAAPSTLAVAPTSAPMVGARTLCLPKCNCPEGGDGRPMIDCETVGGCPHGRSYHYICLCLNQAQVKKQDRWICPRCAFD